MVYIKLRTEFDQQRAEFEPHTQTFNCIHGRVQLTFRVRFMYTVWNTRKHVQLTCRIWHKHKHTNKYVWSSTYMQRCATSMNYPFTCWTTRSSTRWHGKSARRPNDTIQRSGLHGDRCTERTEEFLGLLQPTDIVLRIEAFGDAPTKSFKFLSDVWLEDKKIRDARKVNVVWQKHATN